ncbi:MAG TPA: twin-arginine translocase subunit TatC [Bacteroidales bacterium]|nr:twin-arginine translocase subunit TatC [Bacteroidales bacterium]
MAAQEKGEMTFLEHLEELRWHIIRSVIAIIVIAIAAFVFKNFLFDTLLLGPSRADFWTNRMLAWVGEKVHMNLLINQKPLVLQNTAVAGQFVSHIKISLIAGLALGFPYLFYEFWLFIKPALYTNERRHASGAVFYITFLFVLGITFGYYLITPFSINFLYNYQVSEVVKNIPTLSSYVSLVTSIVLVSGILFELPMLIYFLSQIGLVTPSFLKKYRRHAFVVILLVAGIITPTPDMFTQLMVSLPMILLYEIGIILSRRVEKAKEKAALAG